MLNSRIFRTISFQLTALFCLIFAACLVALLFTTYLTTYAALRTQMQTDVRSQLNTLAEEANSDGVDTIIQDIKERTVSAKNSGFYFIGDSSGQKLAGNIDSVAPVDGWSEGTVGEATMAKIGKSPDEDHEIWGQGMHLPGGYFLYVGEDPYRLLAAQESIVDSFLWSAALALLLAVAAGYLASRGFLRRIDDINTTSIAIMDGKLKQRIPVRGTADEIDRLSANLNRLFDSNQSLLESLKQVSSNIAHDLRSPLTRLRQGLEEAKARPASNNSYAKAIDNAIAESDQLLATFAALLRIAQIESGSRKAGFKDVDLSRLFERVAEAYRAVAEDQGKVLLVSVPENVHYFGDGELLLQMIVNLVENAIRHTQAGAQLSLILNTTEAGPRSIIADTGPGIPAEQRGRVFEHFYRLDSSRTSAGNGLGLALVSAIATLHGIQLTLEDNCPGLRIVMAFPPQK